MHLERQEMSQLPEEEKQTQEIKKQEELIVHSTPANRIYKVYTDTNDPMELSHPEAGLHPSKFEATSSLSVADIIFSYRSIFAPNNAIRRFLKVKIPLRRSGFQSVSL